MPVTVDVWLCMRAFDFGVSDPCESTDFQVVFTMCVIIPAVLAANCWVLPADSALQLCFGTINVQAADKVIAFHNMSQMFQGMKNS